MTDEQLKSIRERCERWGYSHIAPNEASILMDEVERLTKLLSNHRCAICDLRPCLELGEAVIYCDECVSEIQDEVKRLKTENTELRDHLEITRNEIINREHRVRSRRAEADELRAELERLRGLLRDLYGVVFCNGKVLSRERAEEIIDAIGKGESHYEPT